MLSGGGGRLNWVRKNGNRDKVKGIVVIFAWVSTIQEAQLNNYVNLYSSLGFNSLLCLSHSLTPFFPERATTLAFSVLSELLEELQSRPCPVVLASFSAGSKACMYKIFQIIGGPCEAQLNLDDNCLVASCISGQIYDSSPIDFTGDLGVRCALNSTMLRIPGSAKAVSLAVKGVASGLDALFLTRFGSQRSEYWKALYSSVSLGAPFLILCSENDDLALYPSVCSFAQRLQDLGGNVKLVKWNSSPHVGHYKHYPNQYRAAVSELLEQAISVFSQKMQLFGERTGIEGMHGEVFDLVCDLQNAADDSNQSFRRVALGPNDHFFLPSSAKYQDGAENRSIEEERKEKSVQLPNPPSIKAHGVLGQILFDACVPKNIDGWDIKFSGSLKGKPFASHRHSPLNAIRSIRRSRL